MDLEGVGRDPGGRLGGEELGLRGLAGDRSPLVLQKGGLSDEEARGLDRRRHIGDHELDRLERGERLAEGAPLPSVADRLPHGRLGDPNGLRAHSDPTRVE